MTVIKTLRSKCCPKTPSPKITRDVREDTRDVARALARTEAFEQSCREQTHRDAARSPEAHLATWPTEIARTTWRPVRVHTRSHRPEPAPARQVRCQTAATAQGVRCVSVACVSADASKPPLPRERAATRDVRQPLRPASPSPSPTSATKSALCSHSSGGSLSPELEVDPTPPPRHVVGHDCVRSLTVAPYRKSRRRRRSL